MPNNVEVSPVINLAAKMNTRSNFEVLNVDPNNSGLELAYLQNGDLFYTKAVASRLGVTDVCGGIVNATIPASDKIFNWETISPPGTILGSVNAQFIDVSPDRVGMIIIPSGNLNLYSGNIIINAMANALTDLNIYDDVNIQTWVHEIDATPQATPGWFEDNYAPAYVHAINLSGLFNAYASVDNSFPTLKNKVPGFPTPNDCQPIAISSIETVNFGAYTFDPITTKYKTSPKIINYTFDAPVALQSGVCYYVKTLISKVGNQNSRTFNIGLLSNSGTDINVNARIAQEFFCYYASTNYTSNALRAGIAYAGVPEKSYAVSILENYKSPSYMFVDKPECNSVGTAPLVSGSTFGLADSTFTYQYASSPAYFNGLTNTPSVSTQSSEFGNILNVPSGLHTIYGGYFYANILSGNGWIPFTTNKAVFPQTGYNLGYSANLSEVIMSGTNVASRNIIASYSGNYIFNNPYDVTGFNFNNYDPAVNGPATQLDKLYAMFNNPVTINNSGTTQYMLSFKFYDFNSNSPLTDYITKPTTYMATNLSKFASPILIGLQNNFKTGTEIIVSNISNDGQTFKNDIWGTKVNLACGLITVDSGNAITSVYDYRVGDSRTQEIIFTQRDEVNAFKDNDPKNTIVTIWSGAAINDLYKWSHSTFQNMLFSHQYSQSSGVCWDQIYYNPSGQTMQYHGLRPAVVTSGQTITLPAGSAGINTTDPFYIVLATTLNTGGFRSSELVTFSGTGGNAVNLLGAKSGTAHYPYDIQYSGINDGTYQYNFDVNSLGTYVFASQPSGNVFFIAPLCDSAGTLLSNPLPNINTWNVRNSGSGVYIYDNSFVGINSIQVPNVINYSQDYLLNQVNTPQFKKTIVFKNTLYGIGDVNFPSRLWFTEIQAPNILGVDTNFYGYYDIDNDNGQELTGIEVFKDYLIIFKENSCYRASFTANPGNPLEIYQVSNTKGCLGIFTTVGTDYGIIGLNQYGPFLSTYAGIESIGDEILPYFQTLDRTELIYSEGIHDVARQQVYWNINSSNQSQDNQIGLVYSYAEKSWGIRQGGMWNVVARIGDIDNFSKYYAGDTLGQIKQLDSTNADNDILFTDIDGTILVKNISLELETPWMNFGNSQNLKQMKFVKINCDSSIQKLRVDVYYDQNDNKKQYSRYLNMNVPVINRVCSLAGICRTVKLKISSVGLPDKVKINSIQFGYINQGMASNIS